MGSDPSGDVSTMETLLMTDSRSMRVKHRRYYPPQAGFRCRKMYELLHLILVKINYQTIWYSAPHLVAKPGTEQVYFTVDLRPFNRHTIGFVWPMPNLDIYMTQMIQEKIHQLLSLWRCYYIYDQLDYFVKND